MDDTKAGQSTRPSSQQAGKRKQTKAAQRSAFDVLIDRKFNIDGGGVGRPVPAELALKQVMLKQAFDKKYPAMREVLKWICEYEEAQPRRRLLPQIKLDNVDPKHVDDALLILGIASRIDGERWCADRPNIAIAVEFEELAIARRKRVKRSKVSDDGGFRNDESEGRPYSGEGDNDW